jgi:hypothetical protein
MTGGSSVSNRFLRAAGLVAPLFALALAASPAGAWHEISDSGNHGLYTIEDEQSNPGVRCRYENNSGAQHDELDRIRIDQFWTHAPFASKTWVGARYIIQRNTPPYSDDNFTTVYRSPIVKLKANQSEVAFFGPWYWQAPENTNARYRVRIRIYTYAQGSKTNVIGNVYGQIEAYEHKLVNGGGTYVLGDDGDPQYCNRNYHGL